MTNNRREVPDRGTSRILKCKSMLVMWKKLWGVFCCWGMVTGGMAQDVVPVRALSSPEIINPAYYNREAGVSAALWYRHQWGKLEESPQYMGISLHKLWTPGKWGTGVNGGYSKSGYRKDYQFGLTGDRGFALSENSRLSLGLTAGMQLVRYDWPEIWEVQSRKILIKNGFMLPEVLPGITGNCLWEQATGECAGTEVPGCIPG